MNQDDIKKLAIECGFLPPLKWLQDYTAAVEAPLQARIAQLEEFVKDYCVDTAGCMVNGNILAKNSTQLLSESPSTWLSEHDKEVRERCMQACQGQNGFQNCVERIRELK